MGKDEMPCFGDFSQDRGQCIFCPDHDACEKATNNKLLRDVDVQKTETPKIFGDDPRMQGPGPTA